MTHNGIHSGGSCGWLSDYDDAKRATAHLEPRGHVAPHKPIYEMSETELLAFGRDVERRYTPGMHVDGRPITNQEGAAIMVWGYYRRSHEDADELLDQAAASGFDEDVLRVARRIARFIGGSHG